MSATTEAGHRPATAADPEATARRVEEILDRLASGTDPGAGAVAEELVRVLMQFYGAGLARLAAVLASRAGGDGAGLREAVLADELITSLLVLHDLHPEDTATRVRRALAGLDRVELVALDAAAGTLRLRERSGGGCGCGSGGDVRQAVAAALACHAPEVTEIVLEPAQAELPLLQIGRRPGKPAPAGPVS
ncbi:hypothetical protein ACFV3R_08740 [Streptomyces sp. NPDC059740]|uniref:hypothetical protein n=1 Tax=Streptomyces sp. NPDC059740 TaxID=3346926 RepID=UPI0036513F28